MMGKDIHITRVMNLFEKSPVVDYSSIERIILSGKGNRKYTKQLVRNLILKKRIKRITKGYYTIRDNYQFFIFCFKPAYFGLQDALSYHNLWEQETIPIIVTTKKVRNGIRKVFGKNIMIKRIDKKYFFGYDYVEDHKNYFPYSDIEKTFIDMVYFRQRIDKEVLDKIKRRINITKFNLYLSKYPLSLKTRIVNLLKCPPQ